MKHMTSQTHTTRVTVREADLIEGLREAFGLPPDVRLVNVRTDYYPTGVPAAPPEMVIKFEFEETS